MYYNRGALVGGSFTQGLERRWDWTKNGGNYHQHRDFFSVHWEVQDRDPHSIRLHVEAPSQERDPILNAVKHDVIAALLASKIGLVVRQSGHDYLPGPRTSEAAMRRYKCTEAFRVVWRTGSKATVEQKIAAVHEAIGPHVETVLDDFAARLRAYFQPSGHDSPTAAGGAPRARTPTS